MNKFRRLMAAAAAASMAAVVFAGCSRSVDPADIDYSVQLLAPEKGDEIAIFETNLGDITAVLYTEEAADMVQNFKDLAAEGFFDGQVFYQAVPTVGAAVFGSSTPDGESPNTNTGAPIKVEYSESLWPYSGSLCALCGEMGQLWNHGFYFDSRSFFIGDMPLDEETVSIMEQSYFPAMMINAFEEMGGVPGIGQYHAVFGKVIDGMEVVNAIMASPMSPVDMAAEGVSSEEYEQGYTFDTELIIEKVTISTFDPADYPELDNCLTQEEFDEMVYISEEEQVAIDEAIKNGTYLTESEASE